jgi:type II secretory pathway component GspD/PulD (secretin)
VNKNGTSDEEKPWTGILTSRQLKPVLEALEKRKGADLLDEGEVTTLSGRQAQFQIVNVKTLVNGLTATVTNHQTSYNYKLDSEPFGSTLDVVPTVSDDTNSITMRVIPRISEFLGYENPREVAKYDAKLKGAQLPLPKSRIRQTTTVATVGDGQTLVIGNLSDEWVLKEPDGTQLRQPYTDKKKKQLLIFITATIIDPSGNRIHSDDYYDNPVLR